MRLISYVWTHAQSYSDFHLFKRSHGKTCWVPAHDSSGKTSSVSCELTAGHMFEHALHRCVPTMRTISIPKERRRTFTIHGKLGSDSVPDAPPSNWGSACGWYPEVAWSTKNQQCTSISIVRRIGNLCPQTQQNSGQVSHYSMDATRRTNTGNRFVSLQYMFNVDLSHKSIAVLLVRAKKEAFGGDFWWS